MSVSGGDGRRHRSSRLGKGQAVVYSTSPPDIDEEYDAMEASTERASRQEAEELQHQFDAWGDDVVAIPSNTFQCPVYYTSKTMIDPETRYPFEKIGLALVTIAKKLLQHFQTHLMYAWV